MNSNGALAFQNTYDPFGGFTTSGTPPFGYGQVYGMAGIEYDPTGLYHAGPHYYSPILQRFLSEDPIRGKANMYGYAGNNPITGSDVTGLQQDCPLGDCAGGTGGQENTPGDSYGLIGLVASIIQDIFGGGSGGNPAPNFQRFQNQMAFGGFNGSAGIDRANVYTQSGGVFNIQKDEDELERMPGTLEEFGQREIAEHESDAIVRQFLRGALHERTSRSEIYRRDGGFERANQDSDRITKEWALGAVAKGARNSGNQFRFDRNRPKGARPFRSTFRADRRLRSGIN